MNKTWGDIRKDVLNLGFKQSKSGDRDKESYVTAYNWAQSLIASTIGGIYKVMSVVGTVGQNQVFDLVDTARNSGGEYITLADMGITDEYNQRIDGYSLMDNRFLILPEDYEGVAVIHYLGMPAAINTETPDNELCQLPAQWANIMPYLMANRLFLDDDAAKASYYWNLYTDMRDEILHRENSPQISIVGGTDIDGWLEPALP